MNTKNINIKKINAAIKRTNTKFKKASKSLKRVLIAKDVLEQIKSRRYVAESDIWVDARFSRKAAENFDGNNSVQRLFAEKGIDTCRVCALGGLFMSCTNLNNHTIFEQFEDERCDLGMFINNEEKLSNGLNQIFSKKQLMLIEIYFENGCGYFSDVPGVDLDHVKAFGDMYPQEEDRLKEIMKNIIANNGTFVPSKLKVASWDGSLY